MFKIKIFITLILVSVPLLSKDRANVFGMHVINDMFFYSDKDYTGSNGLFFYSADLPLRVIYQIDAYTPDQKYDDLTTPPEGEHPYAGFGSVRFEYRLPFQEYLTAYGVQVGAVGSGSGAQELQDWIHDEAGFRRFAGWSSQVDDAIGLQVSGAISKEFEFEYYRLEPSLWIDTGNLYTKVGAKVTLHTGSEDGEDGIYLYRTNTLVLKLTANIQGYFTLYNHLLSGFDGYQYGVEPTSFVLSGSSYIEARFQHFGVLFGNTAEGRTYVTQDKLHSYSTIHLFTLF
jgi:hypothetical protein